MSVIWTPGRTLYSAPVGRVELDRTHPIADKLTALYRLTPGQWDIDLVSGATRGTRVGTGPFFSHGTLRTTGTTTSYVRLGVGLLSYTGPITIIASWKRISVAGVSWSILRNNSAWTGLYGGVGGNYSAAENNNFLGSASTNSVESVAVYVGTTLRAYGTEGEAEDVTSALVTSTRDTVSLGVAERNTVDNPAISEFDLFGVHLGALAPELARDLSKNIWQIFKPSTSRVIFLPSVAAGAPTLSAVSAESRTSSSIVPRVTVTF
jgi:hypothetical protein